MRQVQRGFSAIGLDEMNTHGVRFVGRAAGHQATGQLGNWATGQLGNWATGQLGNWAPAYRACYGM
jgi:hypothetical protein